MSPDPEGANQPDNRRSFGYSAEEGPVMVVLEAISEVTDTPIEELEPISTVVDPDALADLFGGPSARNVLYRSSGRSGSPPIEVSFRYEGFEVTVDEDRIYLDAD